MTKTFEAILLLRLMNTILSVRFGEGGKYYREGGIISLYPLPLKPILKLPNFILLVDKDWSNYLGIDAIVSCHGLSVRYNFFITLIKWQYIHEETYGKQLKDGVCKNGRPLPSLASLLGIYKPQYCRESLKTNRQHCERINILYSDNCNILCAVLGNIWSSGILIVSKQNWCHLKTEHCNGVPSDIPGCFCWLESG